VAWSDISDVSRCHGKEKAVQIAAAKETLIFSSLRDREAGTQIIVRVSAMARTARGPLQTYGFSQTRDDTEVSRRIQELNVATLRLEETIPGKVTDLVQRLREDDHLTEDMIANCGGTDVLLSPWEKTQRGISRSVQWEQPLAQNSRVCATHTLMKSGEELTFEIVASYTRQSTGKFLETKSQYYFTEDGDTVTYKGAYQFQWETEIWDKEFVESTITRGARISFYFLKSKFSGETFNISKYEGKWKMHQPYVLIIIGLLLLVVGVIVLPADADWYKLLTGFLVLAAFVYL
jgi:hypothetical protein